MNAFIFANAYITNMMITELQYLTRSQYDKIYILGENHRQDNINYKVTICDNLELCLNNSDICFLFEDDNIPPASCAYISQHILKMNKKLIKIKNPWRIHLIDEQISNYLTPNHHIPLILLIEYDMLSQHYITEIKVNKMFHDHNIQIFQEFSKETKELFHSLEPFGMINKYIVDSMDSTCTKAHVNVISIKSKIFEYSEKSFQEAQCIHRLNPDYIILNIEGGIDEKNIVNICEHFKIRYGHIINKVIQSHYKTVLVGQEEPIKLILNNESCCNVNSEIDFDGIASKISLPNDITII